MAHAQKPDFVFRRNGRVHLNRRGRQFSRLLAAEVCASAVVMLETPCSEVVWRILATHSIRQFPLHFLTLAPPCAITFQLDSTARGQWQTIKTADYFETCSVRFLWCIPTTLNCSSNCEITVMTFHQSTPLSLHHCECAVAARQTVLLSGVCSVSSIIDSASLTPSAFATLFYSTI